MLAPILWKALKRLDRPTIARPILIYLTFSTRPVDPATVTEVTWPTLFVPSGLIENCSRIDNYQLSLFHPILGQAHQCGFSLQLPLPNEQLAIRNKE
jgi:hypothetical protein